MVSALAYQFIVANSEEGQRLDRYLVSRKLPHSRSQIQRVISGGHCQLNGVAAKPARKLKAGDEVSFLPPDPEPCDVAPESIPLSVLYEDSQLIVVDKRAGMVVHPAVGHPRGTLVAALLAHCDALSGIGGVLRPGIVHRLDKLTSGVMVASKNDAAHLHLAEQFKAHTNERRYLAIVSGEVASASGCFDTLHGRHPTDRKRYSGRVDRGRRAITHYRVLLRLKGATLVEATLETGRTHQVRVHFSEAGHGLIGDPQYGRPGKDVVLRKVAADLGRQALHARLLAFTHPVSGERLSFAAPLPQDLMAALQALALDDSWREML